MKISIVTTCKSRLHHLKQAVDSWAQFKPHELIVVDVKSPDGVAQWLKINRPEIIIKELDREGFNVGEARNWGATAATGDYLFFVDADILLTDGLHEWFEQHMLSGCYAVRYRENAYDGIHEQGTVLCSREYFMRVGGYDEVFSGYGGEDHDLYEKLSRAGCRKIEYPKKFASALEHSDEERTKYYSIKNKNHQSIINRVYRSLKNILLSSNSGMYELNIETRKMLWSEIEKNIGSNFRGLQGKKLKFNTSINRWLPPPYYLEEKILVTYEIKERPDNKE